MDNILKKQLDCIGEDFLGRIFGDLGKPEREALKHLFGGGGMEGMAMGWDGSRGVVQRAYGLGGTRDASGAGKASEKKSPSPFRRVQKIILSQCFQGSRENSG